MTRGTDRAHLDRAALEAMAYGTMEVLEAMEADAGMEARELRVDGGASLNDWLMQFQADVLGIPVRRPAQVETTALGAAALAGLAAGVWGSGEEFLAAAGEPTRFEAAMEDTLREELRSGWKRAVRAAVGWAREASGQG